MKKIVFFVAFVIAFYLSFDGYFLLSDYSKNLKGTIAIYTNDYMNLPYVDTIKNGNSYILNTDIKNFRNIQNLVDFNKVRGISLNVVDSNSDIFLKKLGLQYTIKNDNEILGYCSKIPYKAFVDGKVVNMQLVEKCDSFVIGFPLILGGF